MKIVKPSVEIVSASANGRAHDFKMSKDKRYLDRLALLDLDRRARHELDRREAEEETARLLTSLPRPESLTQFLAKQLPPRSWTVDRLWERGANGVFTAQHKTGKTTFVANLIRSLCDGVELLGREVVPRGNILFWNCELTESQCQEWLRDMGVRHTGRLRVVNLRGRRIPDLRTPTAQAWAASMLGGVSHWIIDPWRRICREENNNDLATEITEALDVIKELAGGDIDLLLTHHTGRPKKGEEQMAQERGRGATRLDDWADDRWVFVKVAEARFFRADDGRDTDFDETRLIYDPTTRRYTVGIGNRGDAKATAKAVEISALKLVVLTKVQAN